MYTIIWLDIQHFSYFLFLLWRIWKKIILRVNSTIIIWAVLFCCQGDVGFSSWDHDHQHG